MITSCDLLKFHYLCGRITNCSPGSRTCLCVVICSNFTTFAVESPIFSCMGWKSGCCDLLKFHYLCGRITNLYWYLASRIGVVICSNFTTFAVESPIKSAALLQPDCCDLLKFHYLCGRITNVSSNNYMSKAL